MLDYINGNRFQELAEELSKTKGNILKNIIYCKAQAACNNIEKFYHPFQKIILISGDDDQGPNYHDFLRKPQNVVYWYAMHTGYTHPSLIPIPVGLDNDYGHNANPNDPYNKEFSDNLEKITVTSKITDTVYCNWTNGPELIDYKWKPATYGPNPVRRHICEKLKANNVKYVWEEPNIPRIEYANLIATYKFVISPPGSAWHDPIACDSHRTWHALHLGSVPIVIRSSNFREYDRDDFPMIQVDDYSEVTNELLQSYLEKEKTITFNTEKLYMSYWRKRITDQFNTL